MPVTHRFAFTISGGLAMGAYEAGVLSQLYRDFDAVNRADLGCRLVIDAISGASAGSITGLILAQGLALESEPEAFQQRMWQAWVVGPDIGALLQPARGPEESIFTQTRVEAVVAQTIENPPPQPIPDLARAIAIWMAITNVDGIPIRIPFPETDTTLYAFSYRDYAPYLICGADVRDMAIPTEELSLKPLAAAQTWWNRCPSVSWQQVVESALASGSFPIAFRTKPLERDLTRYGDYTKFKQPDWPSKLTCQTMDGGIFGNEPIGKAIDAVSFLERFDPGRARDPRTYLIIEPNPNTPDSIGKALQAVAQREVPNGLPIWTAVLQIIEAYFNDALYSDFMTAHKVNAQLRAVDALDLDAEQKTAVLKAVGLADKKPVALERIPHAAPAKDRLAGDFFGDFGGFLQQDFREQDFHVGRQEARHWLADWLAKNAAALDAGAEALRGALGADPPGYTVNGQPVDLSDASWCAHLTDQRRNEITNEGLDRLQQLLARWLRMNKIEVSALGLLRHLVGGKIHSTFVECPPSAHP